MNLNNPVPLVRWSVLDGGNEPEKESLVIEANFGEPAPSAERKAVVAKVQQLASQELFVWKEFPMHLPPTVIDKLEEMKIDLRQVFRSPLSDVYSEIGLLSGDQENVFGHLSQAQLGDVWSTGRFSVPSKQFPGKVHTWELARWLQLGSKRNCEGFSDILLVIAALWLQLLPASLVGTSEEDARANFIRIDRQPSPPIRFDNGFSVRYALSQLFDNTIELIHMMIGLPRYDSPDEPNECKLEMQHLKQKLALTAPYMFLAKDEPLAHNLKIDATFYMRTKGVSARDSARLSAIQEQLQQDWRAVEQQLKHKWIAEIRAEKPETSDAELLPQLHRRTVEEKQRRLFDAVFADKSLSSPAAILDTVTAFAILEYEVVAIQQQREDYSKHVTDREKKAHPFLAKSYSLIAHTVDKAMYEFDMKHRFIAEEKAAKQLAERKHEQEAYLIRHGVAFRRDVLPGLKEAAWKARPASELYSEERRIWRPQNWQKEYDEHTNKWRLVSKYDKVTVTSAAPFCRFWVFLVAWYVQTSNAAFWTYVSMFHGPLSLRALFGCNIYYPLDRVNADTGEPVPGNTEVMPFAVYLKQLWTSVFDARDEFESRPDAGLLGKSCMRMFNVAWNYIVIGLCGTLLICLIMPLLCLLSFAVSLVLFVACPVWVPLVLAFCRLLQLLFFDRRAKYHYFPLLSLFFMNVLYVLMLVISASTVVLVPLATVLLLLWAVLSWTMRGVWDTLMYFIVLSPRARVPAADSFVARRISGPGLTEHYFYSIHVSDVLLILQIQLEKYELDFYRQWISKLIEQPKVLFEQFNRDVFQPMGASITAPTALSRSTRTWSTKLSELITRRQRYYDELLHPLQRLLQRLRLSSADMDELLPRAEQMVQVFCTERIFPAYTSPEDFWHESNLAVNDWAGVTKLQISTMFGKDFLVPFERLDDMFSLHIQHVDLGEYFAMMYKAQPRDDLSKVLTRVNTLLPKVAERSARSVAEITLNLITSPNTHPLESLTNSFNFECLFGFMVRWLRATQNPAYPEFRALYWSSNENFRYLDIEGKSSDLKEEARGSRWSELHLNIEKPPASTSSAAGAPAGRNVVVSFGSASADQLIAVEDLPADMQAGAQINVVEHGAEGPSRKDSESSVNV